MAVLQKGTTKLSLDLHFYVPFVLFLDAGKTIFVVFFIITIRHFKPRVDCCLGSGPFPSEIKGSFSLLKTNNMRVVNTPNCLKTYRIVVLLLAQ